MKDGLINLFVPLTNIADDINLALYPKGSKQGREYTDGFLIVSVIK